MKIYYTPTWKDAEGNVFFTLSKGDIKETADEAAASVKDNPEALALMDLMGIKPEGIFAFKTESLDDGEIKVEHLRGEHPILGPVAVIGGPAFEKTMNTTPETSKEIH